jgi:hypothetical protein
MAASAATGIGAVLTAFFGTFFVAALGMVKIGLEYLGHGQDTRRSAGYRILSYYSKMTSHRATGAIPQGIGM